MVKTKTGGCKKKAENACQAVNTLCNGNGMMRRYLLG
jgi:hypothetical protein